MEKVRIQLKGMFPHLAPDSSDSPVEWTSNGVPKSKVFGDTYRSFASQSSENDTTARSLKLEDLGLAQSRDVFIQGALDHTGDWVWAGTEFSFYLGSLVKSRPDESAKKINICFV